MRELTDSQHKMLLGVSRATSTILHIVDGQGHTFFAEGKYNVNIIGERNLRYQNNVSNTFDDNLHLIYRDDNNNWQHHIWCITTDPGKYWMNQPGNTKGTAILAPGQYRGAYTIAKHRNQYQALCQRGGEVTVYRDNNQDDKYDFKPESQEVGYFGINIHRSNPYHTSNYIDKWSAGCQVFANPDDFDIFMKICNKAASVWGNKFTYTLIETNYNHHLDNYNLVDDAQD